MVCAFHSFLLDVYLVNYWHEFLVLELSPRFYNKSEGQSHGLAIEPGNMQSPCRNLP